MNAAIINEATDAGNVCRLSPHHRYEGANGMAAPSVTPRQFHREELAWAAGFFDGEGHMRGYRVADSNQRKYPQTRIGLSVSQAGSPELLERFMRAVGVGSVLGPYEYRHKRPTQKPFYVFSTVTFEHAQHCLCCLWPWLGSVKRSQAVEALRYWHAQPRRWFRARAGDSRLVCIRGHRVEGENAYVTKSGHKTCRECRRIWQRKQKTKGSL